MHGAFLRFWKKALPEQVPWGGGAVRTVWSLQAFWSGGTLSKAPVVSSNMSILGLGGALWGEDSTSTSIPTPSHTHTPHTAPGPGSHERLLTWLWALAGTHYSRVARPSVSLPG